MAVKTSWAAGDVLTAADLTDTFAAKLTTPGAWTTYTPTPVNITVGNGTVAAAYAQLGKVVHFRLYMKLGSTSVISADAGFTGPVAAKSGLTDSQAMVGRATYYDASATTWYNGFTKGGYLGYQGLYGYVSGTVPFTWAVNDEIYVHATYEAN